MFQLNQELSLIYPTAEVGFLQLCNHNQMAKHQRSNRSGTQKNLHYFIAPTQNLSCCFIYPAASFCFIQGPLLAHSRSTTRSFKVHYSLIETVRYKRVKLILPKKLFFLVSCLLRPLSIKIISQSLIPQCPSNIK